MAYTNSDNEFGADLLIDSARNIDLRPHMPMYHYTNNECWLWLQDNSYRVKYRRKNAMTGGAYASWTYARK